MEDQSLNDRIVEGGWTLLKLACAGGIIFAVAMAFVTLGLGGDVSEAEADIWTVFASETSKHEAFVETLEDEGMAPPREYDFNGNRTFFSYDTTRESPRQVMYRFQQALVENGVNRNFHATAREPVEPRQVRDDDTLVQGYAGVTELFTGGLIPIEVRRNRMAMIGFETPQGAEYFEDVLLETELGRAAPEDMVGAMRYIDAERDERTGETTITAVWSDEQLDLRKFDPTTPSEGTVHPFEFEVPNCPGCQRVSRLSGTEQEQGYHSLLYRSPESIARVASFFDRHMGEYGWQAEKSLDGLAVLQQRALAPDPNATQIRSYMRDGIQLTVMIYRDFDDGHTYVKKMTNR